MPRYDDHRNITRLYVGHLSPRIRSRDLEDIFSRYGRVRDVDMKRDYAFVEFSDPRDADDAQYALNGRDIKGSRIVVEFSKGVPRAPGGSRDFLGKGGPPPGSGRCFNCGIDGHWARDCKAGDWKNKCYRCGDRGHIERNCQNSPKKLSRGRNYSRSPSPRRYRSRSRSYSKSRRSASPVKRGDRNHGGRRRSRSPRYSRSPVKAEDRRSLSPAPPRGRKRSSSLTPEDDQSPLPPVKSAAARKRSSSLTTPPEEERDHLKNSSPPPKKYATNNGSDYSESPRGGGRGRSRSRSRSRSPLMEDAPEEEEKEDGYSKRRRSPAAQNGRSRSPSPAAPRREGGYPSDNEENRDSPRGSE